MLSCVNYLHNRNIAHRDLKLENILLESNGNLDSIKVIDFGSACQYEDCLPMTEKVGTPYYIAPEVLNKSYTQACDLWSLGVITYILLSNTPPFNAATDQEVIETVKTGQYDYNAPVWQSISADAKDFISQLLQTDSQARPTA